MLRASSSCSGLVLNEAGASRLEAATINDEKDKLQQKGKLFGCCYCVAAAMAGAAQCTLDHEVLKLFKNTWNPYNIFNTGDLIINDEKDKLQQKNPELFGCCYYVAAAIGEMAQWVKKLQNVKKKLLGNIQ